MLIGHAVENYWKLKAIDSIEISHPDDDSSVEERRRVINVLIGRNDIKNIPLTKTFLQATISTTPTTSEIVVIDK